MTAKLLGRNLMPGTIGKAWIIDRKPLCLQKPGQFPRIRTGSIQAQSQRIEADARQIGIEGCHAAAIVGDHAHAQPHAETHGAELELAELRNPRRVPLETAAADDDAPHGITIAIQGFRGRMDHHIGA